MIKLTVLGPVAALVIGSAAGFFAGKSVAPEADQKDGVVADVRSSRRSSASFSSGSGGASSSARSGRVKSVADALVQPGQNSRFQALIDYYAGLGSSEFEREAGKLDDLPRSERMMVRYLLFSRWGEEDPTSAMAYTQTMGFSGMFVRGTVMKSWAAKFPQDAAAYYTEHPNEFRMSGMGGRGRGRGNSTAGAIAAEWARQDSAGAMAWAKSLEGRDQSAAMKSVFSQAAKDDPEKAAGMLSSVTDADALKNAQKSVAREWGKQNWGEAQAWIASLPADDQASASAQALRGLADTDPVEAASNLSSIPEGEERDSAMESIAKKWGRDDPAAAAAWVLESGSESAQKESIGDVMSSWVRADSEAARRFVNEQSEGSVRDNAASSYVMANQGGDVKDNLRLAETIGNNRTRRRAIGFTVAGWMREDPEAANEYLEATEALSKNAKNRIKRWGSGG